MNFLYIFDLLGTFAFAISGALTGVRKNMDIYGMFILALVTGVGGGTTRDIILGRIPPFVFKDVWYLAVTALATLIVFFFLRYIENGLRVLNIADAVGLGVFTCIGATIAVEFNMSWYGVVLCGVMTATVGGMIRDILAGEVPFVLQKEVYASASIAGGFLFLLLIYLKVGTDIAVIIVSVAVLSIRLLAIYKHWNLPKTFKNGDKCVK